MIKKILLALGCVLLHRFAAGQEHRAVATATGKPFVIGLTTDIQSQVLHEKRTLNIYLPEGYNPADTAHYPVVYLLDGSADEDFIHVVGLYQFNTFEWVNRVPKSIIVGIATVDRRRDFTFPTNIEADKQKYPTTGHSDRFMQFLETELQPFIQRTYKTNANRTLIGQSLGGLLAAEILFKKPTLFSSYIIVSPSLWWNNGSLLDISSRTLQAALTTRTQVYIGVGNEGLTPTQAPRVMEADAHLLAKKLTDIRHPNLTVFMDYLPLEDHATIAHQAIYNALRLLGRRP